MERNYKIIEQKRKEMNLTQEELAKVLRIRPNTISQYENGVRAPKPKIAKKLSTILEIPLEDII